MRTLYTGCKGVLVLWVCTLHHVVTCFIQACSFSIGLCKCMYI